MGFAVSNLSFSDKLDSMPLPASMVAIVVKKDRFYENELTNLKIKTSLELGLIHPQSGELVCSKHIGQISLLSWLPSPVVGVEKGQFQQFIKEFSGRTAWVLTQSQQLPPCRKQIRVSHG
jgi:hypothetical protein